MSRRTIPVLGAVILALALALMGCTAGSPQSTGREGPSDVMEDADQDGEARPSMEEVLDSYDAMQRDMIAAVDAELPGLEWQVSPRTSG